MIPSQALHASFSPAPESLWRLFKIVLTSLIQIQLYPWHLQLGRLSTPDTLSLGTWVEEGGPPASGSPQPPGLILCGPVDVGPVQPVGHLRTLPHPLHHLVELLPVLELAGEAGGGQGPRELHAGGAGRQEGGGRRPHLPFQKGSFLGSRSGKHFSALKDRGKVPGRGGEEVEGGGMVRWHLCWCSRSARRSWGCG